LTRNDYPAGELAGDSFERYIAAGEEASGYARYLGLIPKII
jgi:hypothetical protein